MPRLFTGLEVPQEVAFQLSLLRGGLTGARWMEPSDYHVTLRFAGDIDGATARDLADALDEIQADEVTVTVDMLEAFGGGKPRSLFARVKPDKPLKELQADHERLARIVGLPPETRKFTPHITLARLRDTNAIAVADWLNTRAIGRSISFTAKRFVLFSARASVGGGPYMVEAAYPLG